jgi:hypothetical protein
MTGAYVVGDLITHRPHELRSGDGGVDGRIDRIDAKTGAERRLASTPTDAGRRPDSRTGNSEMRQRELRPVRQS